MLKHTGKVSLINFDLIYHRSSISYFSFFKQIQIHTFHALEEKDSCILNFDLLQIVPIKFCNKVIMWLFSKLDLDILTCL